MKRLLPLALLPLAILATGQEAEACAVCYGAPDSPMTVGMNHAIFFLLSVVAVVQLGFVALFVSIMRRNREWRKRKSEFHLIDGGAH